MRHTSQPKGGAPLISNIPAPHNLDKKRKYTEYKVTHDYQTENEARHNTRSRKHNDDGELKRDKSK